MRHHIVVLGAGYAGTSSAGYLARHLHRDDFEITVVNAEPDFVERLRLHQLAAGKDLRRHELADIFADTGIALRIGAVTAIDLERKVITMTEGRQATQLEYDTLLYTLGSTIAEHDVAGVPEHAMHIAGQSSALRLRHRLDELGDQGSVLVVGGNLTAIEGATEIADRRPGLRVTLATDGELGGWLGPKARAHLYRAFDRLGIAVHEHTSIKRVTATGAIAADGTTFAADATVWAAGFATHPIAAASGLAVEDNGQITVDRMMRSVSHPDVYAAGDSAYAIGTNGLPLPMTCATAGFTGRQATSAIIGELTGRKAAKTALVYPGNCISLGQRDGLLQIVDGEARSKSWAVRGWLAARIKAGVLRGTVWNQRNPTYGLPARKYRRSSAAERDNEAVNA
ncbi:NADH dehydrogenase FAD-containing subunit [Tamaricihabitans halophyticus]|uniref:NADH dehydrogenase FAD-containing subunit n=1 Tax=Tamaricihabitans halophyticus TaxID=1262583 RepID=A0A4R2QK22_9PSEU|nr:FAD-dependent oxidoreductase [Tamaricihabitans halophyticus]TCP47335.1 NADH dehydrogenase FAD-containing subunit [Tamaricihabitans halophyticus]